MSREDPPVLSIDLLREPATTQRWADETVTLALHADGDLVLRARATGKAVEMVMGEGINHSDSRWTVAAADVPRLLNAAVRALFGGTPELRSWLAARGIPASDEEWHGFGVRPASEQRFLLEALRDIIGVQERDEGAKMAERYLRWVSSQGVPYEFDEQVREGY